MLVERPDGIGRLEHAATMGVVLLAIGSFVLSYDALHQLAVTNHVPKPLSWIWPLIVDGFIVTASLAVLHAILTGRPATYPWLLVLAFSTTSVFFNVLHAPATVVARLVAAIPPLTLVLSFELLMRQLRDRLGAQPSNATVTHRAPTAEATPRTESQATPEPIRTAMTTGRASLLQHARDIHRQHRQDGTELTGKSLGQILGVSDGYARRLLREIAAAESPRRVAEQTTT